MRDDSLIRNIDWVTVLLYALFITAGWLNIFAVVYDPDPEVKQNIFDLHLNSGKQLLWIGSAFILILMIFAVDFKFYSAFAYVLYAFIILVLIATIFIGLEINGSHSWIGIGDFRVQPAEFAKLFTALALSRYLGDVNTKFERRKTRLTVAAILLTPCIFILLQNETGGVLVFSAFILVLFREGLSPWILIIGVASVALFIFALIFDPLDLALGILLLAAIIIVIRMLTVRKLKARTMFLSSLIAVGIAFLCIGFVFSVDFAINHVLKEHQRNRIMVLVNPEIDKRGQGYQINQSKVAIGSGGFAGQGFLQGTQTKFDFVPEQSTDFIFCTIGEEHGWLGCTVLIVLYILFLVRLINLAERQKEKFAKLYGYCVASIIFFHFMVNIGMTIGVFPIIGIPLPFFSYGGSSLWSFTILLFIFLKLDAHRKQVLAH
ncbi:MAG TPA: rod shape-determining protein RodA [Cytophagaceae bacterium]|jgi:rod shape determining protein RodA|nr:rod shape-determining protein RodA [Cytophagaceae bacterium]